MSFIYSDVPSGNFWSLEGVCHDNRFSLAFTFSMHFHPFDLLPFFPLRGEPYDVPRGNVWPLKGVCLYNTLSVVSTIFMDFYPLLFFSFFHKILSSIPLTSRFVPPLTALSLLFSLLSLHQLSNLTLQLILLTKSLRSGKPPFNY